MAYNLKLNLNREVSESLHLLGIEVRVDSITLVRALLSV